MDHCVNVVHCRIVQAVRLDALFYKPSSDAAAVGVRDAGGATTEIPAAREAPRGAGALPDLPLWRVQWATLPGTQVLRCRRSMIATHGC